MLYEGKMTIENKIFKIQAKIYDQGSEYGINEGRISKLWIWLDGQVNTIYCYDRGDENIDPEYSRAIDSIKSQLLAEFN